MQGKSGVITVLATGRNLWGHRGNILRLLWGVGLQFDEVWLNPGLDVVEFKRMVLSRLMRLLPNLERVILFDNHSDYLDEYGDLIMGSRPSIDVSTCCVHGADR